MHKLLILLIILSCPMIGKSQAGKYDSIPKVVHQTNSAASDSQTVEQLLLSSNLLMGSDLSGSINKAKHALQLARASGYMRGEIDALCKIGTLQSMKNDYSGFLKSYVEARSLAQNSITEKLPDVYNQYANTLSYIGNYREAAENYYKAVEAILASEGAITSRKKLLRIYYNLYSMWRYLDQFEQGMYYLDKAENLALVEKDSQMLSRIYAMKGTENLNRNDAEARRYLLQALDIETSRKQLESEIDNRTVIYTYLAHYYINRNEHDSANFYMQQIMSLYPTINTPHAKVICLLSIGEMHRWMHNYYDANSYFHKGIREARKLEMQFYIQRGYQSLSLNFHEMKNFDSAYHYQQLSYKIKNELTNETQLREISFLEHQHRLIQSERQLAEQHLRNATLGKTIARRNGWIVLSCLLASGLIAIYFVIKRHRRRKLRLQQEQISALIKEMELEQLEMEIQAKEAERKRVAMELHDGIGSLLYVARLNINALSKSGPSHAGFTAASELVNHTIKDLRGYSHSLFPEMLLQNGLEPALRAVWKQDIANGHLLIRSYGEPKQTSTGWNKAAFRVLHQLSEPAHGKTAAIPNLIQLNWHQDMLFVVAEWHSYPTSADSAEWEDIRLLVTHFGGNLEFDTPDAESLAVNLEFPYSV